MKKIYKVTIFVIILILVVGVSLYFLSTGSNKNFPPVSKDSSQEQEPKTTDLYQQILRNCPDKSLSCFEENIKDITQNYGPKTALDILRLLKDNNLIEKSADDHQIAHIIGRDTANFFGINSKAFLSCPTSFNYGCQHGYFEAALVKIKPAKKAIDLICGSLDNEYSAKFKFYCYHGVGHGVMNAQAYDLKAALDICDTLDDPIGQDGCWQGVFMENVNAGMRGEARKGVFSQSNPLAPCNQVADKYKNECYINHAGWLMKFFGNDVEKAAVACLKAENYVNSCLQSIGLMVTNPVWQPAPLNDIAGKDNTEIAREICLKFPWQYREQCVVAGVDNILNFDELDTTRAQKFCDIVDKEFQSPCYQYIGLSLKNQVTDDKIILQKCSAFNDNF